MSLDPQIAAVGGFESRAAHQFSLKQGLNENCHGVARRAKPDSYSTTNPSFELRPGKSSLTNQQVWKCVRGTHLKHHNHGAWHVYESRFIWLDVIFGDDPRL